MYWYLFENYFNTVLLISHVLCFNLATCFSSFFFITFLFYFYNELVYRFLFFLLLAFQTVSHSLDIFNVTRFLKMLQSLESTKLWVRGGHLYFTRGIRKWVLTYRKEANANDTYAIFTYVKHITMSDKITITIFTQVNEYIQQF